MDVHPTIRRLRRWGARRRQDGGSWASGLPRKWELRVPVATRKLRLERYRVQGFPSSDG